MANGIPTISKFGLQSGTDRTLYVAYNWPYGHAKDFQIRWDYDTGDGVWYFGQQSRVPPYHAEGPVLYTFPDNAKAVKVVGRVWSNGPNYDGNFPNWSGEEYVSNWSAPTIYNVPTKEQVNIIIETTGSPTNIIVNKQTGASSTLYASWVWQKDNTDHYEYVWQYYVNGIWFAGSEGNCTVKNCTYSVPSNAVLVMQY